MSAVDAPPGLSYAGLAVGEFRSRPGPRRLSRIIFTSVCLLAGTTMAVASRRLHIPDVELVLVGPLTCIAIAAVGVAVRSARLRIETGGVRWGWEVAGFRLGRSRIRLITVYGDAVAVEPERGSTWFLSARDWQDFERLPRAFRKAGLEVEQRPETRAPLRARLQSYGRVLDGLLVLILLMAMALLVLALGG